MDTPRAYVWRLQNFVLGEHILTPCPENPTPVKACAISACGNFAVLGTAGGWIERFNLQSGISRGNYVDALEGESAAHNGEVIGIACDATNTIMISAGYHGDISVYLMLLHRGWFVNLRDRITDMCFSEDGKWLLTSSMDGTLRIWDVNLARQIDAIQVDLSITALSLSPNMDIFATSHVDQNGVYLWVNHAMFSGAKEIVSVKMPPAASEKDGEKSKNRTIFKPLESSDTSVSKFQI
ncbi:hypothetical protein MTR67_004161 [Solanum verrucosum]|uniref:Uncharacterized protein n=1 Tax=Solanum verrucosum TaxID=315347 RepID=A0AAF0T9Z6_SOLVR|nr:hypothetical protein MTR67_004161 [Solanum verrucosum]